MLVGQHGISIGASHAGDAFFDIRITGKGSHGARPEASIDPVVVAAHITAALQSVVARNVPPADTAVLSVTKIVSGDAYNVIPQTALLAGTCRAFDPRVMTLMETALRRLAFEAPVNRIRNVHRGSHEMMLPYLWFAYIKMQAA